MDSFFPIFEKQQFYGSEKVYKNLDRINIYFSDTSKTAPFQKMVLKDHFLSQGSIL